jgi:hypothetical protein
MIRATSAGGYCPPTRQVTGGKHVGEAVVGDRREWMGGGAPRPVCNAP